MTTLAEVLDAMERNGYPKGKGEFIIWDDITSKTPKVVEACAVGQAALNLDLDPSILYDSLNFYNDEGRIVHYGDEITRMNDNSNLTIPQIAQYYREVLKEYLDMKIEF